MFSHPELVRDLLVGFVNEPWVAELDFTTLEKTNGSYVADDLRNREDDIIWRVRFKDQWLYLYLLLEFQSSEDRWMPLRILTYLGLLYQDLIRQGRIGPGEKLTPVLPLVLYNGKTRWRARIDIADLIETAPGSLRDYAPRLKYLLLDEGAIDESAPWALRNLAAALFRLEKSPAPAELASVIGALLDWLKAPEQASLKRAFEVWIKRVLLPGRLPGVSLPEVGDLLEVKTMLAERVIEWTEQWKQQGLQEGLQQGLQQGKLQGEATLLERQLTRKFGPLSAVARTRLHGASLDQLETWADRILDAPSFDAVFDDH